MIKKKKESKATYNITQPGKNCNICIVRITRVPSREKLLSSSQITLQKKKKYIWIKNFAISLRDKTKKI